MIIDNPINDAFYDIIIIGSGPAGITLAKKIENKFKKIAIVEAGERYYSEESQKYYRGFIDGLFPQKLSKSRLSMFGGTTGHWGRTCRTHDEHDFYNWPIKKNTISAYQDEACKNLEVKNLFRTENINENLNLIEFQQSKTYFPDKYYSDIESSKNINLYLQSPMIELIGEDNITKKIKCFSKKKREFFYINSKIFVIASGGIENSRILLLEKKRNKKLFNNNIPVGNYWYEHPSKFLGNAFINSEKIKKQLNTSLNNFGPRLDSGDGENYSFAPTYKLIKNEKILNSCCWLVTHERKDRTWKRYLKDFLCIAPSLTKNAVELFDKKLYCGASIISSWEQDPEFSNRIELSNEIDKFGNNLPILKYKKSEIVRKTARVMFEKIGEFLIKEDLGRLVGENFLFDEKKNYLSDAGWHHMGGTIMGKNPNNSVVDSNLRVHGSKNIFVVGSSVFPTGGHANPTLTITQLSLRLGDYLINNNK